MAATDAWPIGPSQTPPNWTQAYSPPDRFTPRRMIRWPAVSTSALPDTCSGGAAPENAVIVSPVVLPPAGLPEPDPLPHPASIVPTTATPSVATTATAATECPDRLQGMPRIPPLPVVPRTGAEATRSPPVPAAKSCGRRWRVGRRPG